MKKINRIALFVIIIAGLMYASGWYYFSKKFEVHFEKKLAQAQSKGFDVSFDKLSIGGFPFGYSVTAKNLSLSKGNFFRTWIDGDITFSTKLWKPQEISSVAAGTHYLEFDNIKMKGDKFILKSLLLDPLRFTFSYGPLKVNINDNPVLSADNFEAGIELMSQMGESNLIQLKANGNNVSSLLLENSPLGGTIQNFGLTSFLQGNFEGRDAAERLTNWYKSDGTLDIKNFTLKYGSLGLNGEGTLSVDNNLQPVAAFTLAVDGLDNTIDSFIDKKLIKRKVGNILKAGANFFNIGNESKLSFSIQDQKVMLGGIPVAETPKIIWTTDE